MDAEQGQSAPEPTALPGDIIQQVIENDPLFGAPMMVDQTYGWGIGAAMHAVVNGELVESYHRLRHDQFVVIGMALIVPAEIAERRKAAVQTARTVAAEAERAK